MRLFWAQGYEGASIDALTIAMGVPRSTLYQAWGDKQALFLAAVDHYARTRLAPLLAALDGGGPLRKDVGAFLDGVVALATADPAHLGCLVSCALADAAGAQERMQAELAARFATVENRIAARLQKAQEAGDLARTADTETLTGVLAAIARGLMLSARAGTPAAVLRRTAHSASGMVAPARG